MIRWRQFFSRKQNLLGLFIVAIFFLVAAAAPLLAPPENPDDPQLFKSTGQSFARIPEPPSEESILGTTPQIRDLPRYGLTPGQDRSSHWDVYYTLIWGTRSALQFGLTVVLITALFGITVGAVSGYIGGTTNRFTMGITDAFLAFPAIAGIWLLQRTFFSNILNPFQELVDLTWWESLLNQWHIDPIMLALILFSWMPYARVVNSMVSSLRQEEYIVAAVSMGATNSRIIFKHLLPNALSPAVVIAARDVGGMVILASAFIFLGFAGNVAWGIMLVAGRDFVIGLSGNPFAYWWTFVPISLALILFGVGWNLLGDGLNTALNPRSRH